MLVANAIEAKPISDRKRAANRANAQKSTGPRTIEGKAKVSLNAVSHGLRAEMVVLPKEDPAMFEAMRLGLFKDWNPQTETRRVLVERIAADAWRMRRCVKIEHDRISDRIETALANHEAGIQIRMKEGFRLLSAQPARAIEFFKGEYTGVKALIRAWQDLGEFLDDPTLWNQPQCHIRLLNLLGLRGDTDAMNVDDSAVLASWQLYVWNCPDDGQCDDPIRSAADAKVFSDALANLVAHQVTELEASLADYPDPDLVRQRIAERASYDTSAEGRALQRYEGQLSRDFRSNLNQIMKLAQTGSDLVEEMEAPAEAPNKATEAAPAEASNKSTEAIDATIEATEVTLEAPNKPTEARVESAEQTHRSGIERVSEDGRQLAEAAPVPLIMHTH